MTLKKNTMENKEIKENNVLIAEFMNYEFHDNVEYKAGHPNPIDFKYHKSWDWLIPVVTKCTNIGYGNKNPNFDNQWNVCFDDTFSAFIDNDINSIYNAVVKFIKYITNTKNEEN